MFKTLTAVLAVALMVTISAVSFADFSTGGPVLANPNSGSPKAPTTWSTTELLKTRSV